MKTRICILVTDGDHGLIFQRPGALGSLPNESVWPLGKRPRRQNWPHLVLAHALYGNAVNEAIEKQKRAFGLASDTSWYLCKLSREVLQQLVVDSKTQRLWWYRYADATVPWSIKLCKLTDFKKDCDASSAHCVEAFLSMSK